MKKIALLLLCSILVQFIVSCSAGGSEPTGGSSANTGEVKTAVTDAAEDRSMLDDIPALDFEGYTFRSHTRTQPHFQSKIIAEEQTGETLNDAIYNRKIAVEERFNIKFYETYDSNSSDPTGTARKVILAGDDAYDMFILGASGLMALAIEGLVYNISEIPYIDLTKDYWDHSLNAELSFCGEQYFASGAMNLTAYDVTHILCFNKKMITDLNLDSPYQLVDDGKWTYDNFSRLSSAAVSDVNGDGKMDGEDSYGLVAVGKQVMPSFWTAAGERSVDRNSDDEPVFQIASDPRYLSVFSKIFEITWDNNAWFQTTIGTQFSPEFNKMFQENRALFYDSTFFYVSTLRDMESDFGIIPYPKYDEAQENYHSRVEVIITFLVPKTNTELERTGAIIEGLSSESAKTVIPAYYEVALKTKYTRDTDSERMLDLIFNGRILDLGDSIWYSIYRDALVSVMFRGNDRDIASKLASLQPKMDATLADVTSAFLKLKESK